MTLIAAAVVAPVPRPMYHLATSAINPVNMGRSIELTGLPPQALPDDQSIDSWLKVKLDNPGFEAAL